MRLTEIHEKPSTPLELKTLTRYFLTQGRKEDLAQKIRSEWGAHRLTYLGQPFFVHDEEGNPDLGPAYERVEQKAKRAISTVDVNITVDHFDIDGERFRPGDFEFEAKIDDMQEVYLGYDPDDNSLWIGFDAWISEEEFNEEWDRYFEQATDMEFNHDDREHAAAFNIVWQVFKNMGFFGILVKVPAHGSAEEIESSAGGFYKAIYRTPFFKGLNLIDLRLD